MVDECCPRCDARFPADRAWANQSIAAPSALQNLDTRVRCPACGHVFQAVNVRFFGFLTAKQMKWLATSIVIGAAAYGFYFAFFPDG